MSDSALPTMTDLRVAAMNLLARREQSAEELKEKLQRRFSGKFDGDKAEFEQLVEAVLLGLKEDKLQSDERFTDAFVSMRKRQGKGPLRIVQELRQKGVASELIDTYMAYNDPLWWEIARDLRERRFGSQEPPSPKEKARQIRFLQYRGFTQEQIRAAMDD